MADEFKTIDGQDNVGKDTVPVASDERLNEFLKGAGYSPVKTEQTFQDGATGVGIESSMTHESIVEAPNQQSSTNFNEPAVPVEQPKVLDPFKDIGVPDPTKVEQPVNQTTETPKIEQPKVEQTVEQPQEITQEPVLQEWEIEKQSLVTERDELLKTIDNMIKTNEQLGEYMEDPYKFRAKYEPHLIEKFNDGDYIREQLAKEFGAEFELDLKEAMTYGTPSWNYVQRQRDLVDKVKEIRTTAQQTISNTEQERNTQMESYLSSVRQKYNFEPKLFDTEVRPILTSSDSDLVTDFIVKGIIAVKNLAQIQKTLTQAPTNSKPSPTTISDLNAGIKSSQDTELDKIEAYFGKKRVEVLKRQ